MTEEFKLSEYWCIEVTEENSLLIGEYFSIVSQVYTDWYKRKINGKRKYLRSHNDQKQPIIKGADSSFSNHIPQGLVLTTEQFKKYVLNSYDPSLENIYKKLLS